jgi:hypothetical protein
MNDVRTTANVGRNLGDQVIYYRRPNEGENAGWITWGDSASGTKLRDFGVRGFQPLYKYGVINSKKNQQYAEEHGISPDKSVWIPILTHPDGPAEFPLEQIMTLRWYRPENCPIEGVVWPQLTGVKIKEYRCPECKRPPFINNADGVGAVYGLGNHLRIMHGWDRVALMAYGDRIGIDFNAVDVMNQLVKEYEPATKVRKSRVTAEPQVEIEVV